MSSLKNVIENEYCVGCGACAYLTDSKMHINKFGEYVPDTSFVYTENNLLDQACPFLSPSLNEDVLAKNIFGATNSYDSVLGYYLDTFASFVKEENYREKGTSGGTTTWIVTELLKKGLIDGVIHVKEFDRKNINDPYYKYGISYTEDEIREASKTRYHVVEMSEVLAEIKGNGKKYAVIGVPCMIKTIRRLQLIDENLQNQIPFTISLVCGHLKSINWSVSLAWGAGIAPKDSTKIQYRTKGDDIPARAYVFRAENNQQQVIQKDSASVAGGKFNAGALMLKGCEYCDDVIGETSDLTVGDAWLPRFESDDHGTNLLVVRNHQILQILQEAKKCNRIELINISKDDAIRTQTGGYRQRREGLSYRLDREIKKGNWVPEKRIKPNQFQLTSLRKKIYDGRSKVTEISRVLFKEALEKNDYKIYDQRIMQLTKDLRKKEILNSLPKLLMNKMQRTVLRFLKRS
jgi:coenzyme F420-reducing hydrogenase beta subunit